MEMKFHERLISGDSGRYQRISYTINRTAWMSGAPDAFRDSNSRGFFHGYRKLATLIKIFMLPRRRRS